MYKGTYLSKIPQKELVQQIERYRDACPFRVESAVHWDEYFGKRSVIRITANDGALDIFYAASFYHSIPSLLREIEAGPNGIYVWSIDMYNATDPPPAGYQPTKRGKWIEIRDAFVDEMIIVLPWCDEIKEALAVALKEVRGTW